MFFVVMWFCSRVFSNILWALVSVNSQCITENYRTVEINTPLGSARNHSASTFFPVIFRSWPKRPLIFTRADPTYCAHRHCHVRTYFHIRLFNLDWVIFASWQITFQHSPAGTDDACVNPERATSMPSVFLRSVFRKEHATCINLWADAVPG